MSEAQDLTLCWHLLQWVPLDLKRSIAVYVCTCLCVTEEAMAEFLALFPIDVVPLCPGYARINRGPDPLGSQGCAGIAGVETALRELLLLFPFLPIDAGMGADRVLGAFSEVGLISRV
jgi:hypothetical protein